MSEYVFKVDNLGIFSIKQVFSFGLYFQGE